MLTVRENPRSWVNRQKREGQKQVQAVQAKWLGR